MLKVQILIAVCVVEISGVHYIHLLYTGFMYLLKIILATTAAKIIL